MILILLAAVIGMTIVGVAAFMPSSMWDAIEHRVRNPRPDPLSELHRHWEVMDRKGQVEPDRTTSIPIDVDDPPPAAP